MGCRSPAVLTFHQRRFLTASARLLANPAQLLTDQTLGPSSASYRSAFQGWTVAELSTLDRYRVKAV
jgi:hypothetical protein